MRPEISESDGRRALRDHACEKAAIARGRYGPIIDAAAILRILGDAEIVRYPTRLVFDAIGLMPGEFAHAAPLGEHPRDGFEVRVHPLFESRRDLWPLLVAYHLPPINYGDIVAPEDCEQFGAALLGMDVERYYETLCELSDSITDAACDDGSHVARTEGTRA
ncbi:MAG: hypothetical protein U0572_14720 [Phycisphaerales bacterium]